jgi:hypothetical protein
MELLPSASLVHGAWCMVHGAWCMVHGAWCMVHGDIEDRHGLRCGQPCVLSRAARWSLGKLNRHSTIIRLRKVAP